MHAKDCINLEDLFGKIHTVCFLNVVGISVVFTGQRNLLFTMWEQSNMQVLDYFFILLEKRTITCIIKYQSISDH